MEIYKGASAFAGIAIGKIRLISDPTASGR